MGRGTIGQMGTTAVIQVGGVEIILTEKRIQPYDTEVLRSVGIEPLSAVLANSSLLNPLCISERITHPSHTKFWTWIPLAFTVRIFSIIITRN